MALAACGDDSGGGSMEDGGVSLDDIDMLDDRIDTVGSELDNLGQELDDVAGNLEDTNTSVDDLNGSLDEHASRLDALENPDVPNCSESELCIPDGIDHVQASLESVIGRLCQIQFDCCDEGERRVMFGPGIADADDCVDTFMSQVANGITPGFLDIDDLVDESTPDSQAIRDLVQSSVMIAHAINNSQVRVTFDPDALNACLEWLEAFECPSYADGEGVAHCEEYAVYQNPCDPMLIVHGRQQLGEVCGLLPVNECAEGVCRAGFGPDGEGLCAPLAEAGDACSDDGDCDPYQTDLFCNVAEGECQAAGDEGDDCGYVDPTFTYYGPTPNFSGGTQNPWALRQGCKHGLGCDPNSNTCVPLCSDGIVCWGNHECPEGLTCNVTQNPNLRNTYGLGVCRDALAVDDPCTWGTECATGRCMFDGSKNVCFPALKAVGEACTVNVAGVGQYDSSCETGFCAADSTTTTDGKCAAMCDEQSDCPNTHFCDWDNTYDESTAYCDLKRADGAACNPWTDHGDPAGAWNDYECASGHCNDAANTTLGDNLGQCAAKGSACASGQDSACSSGQYCNVATCANFIAVDGDCSAATSSSACGPGNYCFDNGTTQTCQAYSGSGGDCTGARECDPHAELECVTVGTAEQCHAVGAFPDGADCSGYGDSACTNGWCRGSDGTCQTPIAAGEDCDTNDPALNRCAAGHYCHYDLDADPLTYAGECRAIGGTGAACDPRYGGEDCMSNDCELMHDAFVCTTYWSEERRFCGGVN